MALAVCGRIWISAVCTEDLCHVHSPWKGQFCVVVFTFPLFLPWLTLKFQLFQGKEYLAAFFAAFSCRSLLRVCFNSSFFSISAWNSASASRNLVRSQSLSPEACTFRSASILAGSALFSRMNFRLISLAERPTNAPERASKSFPRMFLSILSLRANLFRLTNNRQSFIKPISFVVMPILASPREFPLPIRQRVHILGEQVEVFHNFIRVQCRF